MVKIPKENCHFEEQEPMCEPKYVEECEEKPQKNCKKTYEESCVDVPKEECKEVTRKKCRQEPLQVWNWANLYILFWIMHPSNLLGALSKREYRKKLFKFFFSNLGMPYGWYT